MKISIVTPSYNQHEFIADAIQSVEQQNYGAYEHLIMDNCSNDGTGLILSRYPGLKVLSESDQGQSDALNKGFKMASGDIIGWLNADDRYLPGCFRTVADFFMANPSCDVLYGDYRIIDEKGAVIQYRKELDFDLFMLKYLHILYIPSTTAFFRRRIFEDGNFLDIHYHYSMDYEFFLRLALKGYRFRHLGKFLADFRTHAASKSQIQAQKQRQEMEEALFAQDQALRRIKDPWRLISRQALMLAARSKRYGLKLFSGAYLQ